MKVVYEDSMHNKKTWQTNYEDITADKLFPP